MAKGKRSKKTAKRPAPSEICFVVMPFGGWLDDYYELIYKPAIEDAGLDPHRADDLFRPSTIVHDIWDYTKRARLLVGDLTGKNPNVFYELGLAHALAKPAVLIAESIDDIPFDLRALRILIYDKNEPDWGSALRRKISSAIKEVLKAPAKAVLPTFLNDSGETPKPKVTPHDLEILELRQEVDALRRSLNETRRGDHVVDIGPREAERLISMLVNRGLPTPIIMDRLHGLGPPRSWIQRKAEELRVKATKGPAGSKGSSRSVQPPPSDQEALLALVTPDK
jgi:hypothetical protein